MLVYTFETNILEVVVFAVRLVVLYKAGTHVPEVTSACGALETRRVPVHPCRRADVGTVNVVAAPHAGLGLLKTCEKTCFFYWTQHNSKKKVVKQVINLPKLVSMW